MLKQWCIGLSAVLSEYKFIPKDEIDVYAYGLQIGFEMLLNFLTTLAIGFCLGAFWESILLFASYMSLRSFTGGFHAKTFVACYILSNMLVLVLLVLCQALPEQNRLIITIALTALSYPVVFVLAPVQTPNKSMEHDEIAHHRRQSRARLIAETIAVVVLLAVKLHKFALLISLGLGSISILMLIGAIKNRIYPI